MTDEAATQKRGEKVLTVDGVQVRVGDVRWFPAATATVANPNLLGLPGQGVGAWSAVDAPTVVRASPFTTGELYRLMTDGGEAAAYAELHFAQAVSRGGAGVNIVGECRQSMRSLRLRFARAVERLGGPKAVSVMNEWDTAIGHALDPDRRDEPLVDVVVRREALSEETRAAVGTATVKALTQRVYDLGWEGVLTWQVAGKCWVASAKREDGDGVVRDLAEQRGDTEEEALRRLVAGLERLHTKDEAADIVAPAGNSVRIGEHWIAGGASAAAPTWREEHGA